MKKNSSLTAISICIALLSISQIGCYKDNKESLYPATVVCDTTVSATWSGDIQKIVNNSCSLSGCHDGSSASGGYALDNFSGVKNMVANNRFLSVVESGRMPKGASKLDDCSIGKIRSWINNGALEN